MFLFHDLRLGDVACAGERLGDQDDDCVVRRRAITAGPEHSRRVAAEERVTVFGTDAGFLTTCEQLGVRPRESSISSALRTVISTGAPLTPASYRYVYRDVHPDVQLSAVSGRADTMACFGAACPLLPVYEGECQALGLGMKVEIFDDAGKPVIGRQGALVCSQPFPSLPLGFWGDPQADRLVASYFRAIRTSGGRATWPPSPREAV